MFSITVVGILLSDINGAVRFERFFGALNPTITSIVVIAVGALALRFLNRRYGFAIAHDGPPSRPLIRAVAATTLLAGLMVLVDIARPFPADINVPLPWALVFYPAMGLIAECCFHVIPLAILFGASVRSRIDPFDGGGGATTGYCLFVIVALIEPVFQIVAGLSLEPFTWRDGCVGLLIFVFNLLQLQVFRRFGFVAMYALRMTYYLWWHLIWGSLRIDLLIP